VLKKTRFKQNPRKYCGAMNDIRVYSAKFVSIHPTFLDIFSSL
jgi:hypothetical protein